MESFNKKTNHDLLKIIDKLTAKHLEIKESISKKVDEITTLEHELVNVENEYIEAFKILKERL